MDEELTTPSQLTMVALTPNNYCDWIAELKALTTRAKVWQYIDPNSDKEQPQLESYPKFSNYTMVV